MVASPLTSPATPEVDFSDGAAFVNGEYVPASEAKISVFDFGFTRSDVTYDVVSVWNGRFFLIEHHLTRFEKSCQSLRLELPHTRDELREILINCVRLSGQRDAYVDMICTRGRPRAGSRDIRQCDNQFIAYAVPYIWIFTPEKQEQGGHLVISNVPRIPPESVDPTVKNFHWGDLTQGLLQAFDSGADTAVLIDMEGYISEGPGFNVFCIRDGAVLSPGDTVLEGVTRASVRELCKEMNIPFSLAKVTPDELRDADEVFLSSTAGGVMPIRRVDERIISNDAPGEITMRLRGRYWEKRDEGWHATEVDYG